MLNAECCDDVSLSTVQLPSTNVLAISPSHCAALYSDQNQFANSPQTGRSRKSKPCPCPPASFPNPIFGPGQGPSRYQNFKDGVCARKAVSNPGGGGLGARRAAPAVKPAPPGTRGRRAVLVAVAPREVRIDALVKRRRWDAAIPYRWGRDEAVREPRLQAVRHTGQPQPHARRLVQVRL